MRPEKKALENAVFISLSWLFTTLGGFLLWLVAGKFLNQEEYGIALTAASLCFFIISFITLGLPAALSKLIPEYKSGRKSERIKHIISLALLIIFLANAMTISMLLALKDKILPLLKVPEKIYYFMLIYILIGSFSTTFYTITYSFQEMKKYFLVGTLAVILRISVAIAVMLLGFKYFGPIVGLIISSFLTLLLCFPFGKIKIVKRFFDEDLYKYAITGFIGAFVSSMLTNFHYTIITIVKSNINTGIFGVAMMISSVISAIPSILNTSIYPIISETFKTKSKKSIPVLLENTIKYSLLFALPLILTFSILSNFVVLSFSSYKFLDSAKLIPILSIGTLFLGLSFAFMNALFAVRRPKTYIKILFSVAAIFLLLTIPLTKAYSETGMSVGYALTAIMFFAISFAQIKKQFSLEIDIKQILKIFLASSSFIILYLARPSTLMSVALLTSLNFLIYFLILFLLKFFDKRDYLILKYFLKKLKRN